MWWHLMMQCRKQNSKGGGRKGLRWCDFALFLVRFCGNFYFNLQYCSFKTLSGLQLLQPLGCNFGEKKGLRWWYSLERMASGCFASTSQVFCKQGLLYQFINAQCYCWRQLSYSGLPCTGGFGIREKNLMQFAVFWRMSLRFLDPPYAPSKSTCATTWHNPFCPSREMGPLSEPPLTYVLFAALRGLFGLVSCLWMFSNFSQYSPWLSSPSLVSSPIPHP